MTNSGKIIIIINLIIWRIINCIIPI